MQETAILELLCSDACEADRTLLREVVPSLSAEGRKAYFFHTLDARLDRGLRELKSALYQVPSTELLRVLLARPTVRNRALPAAVRDWLDGVEAVSRAMQWLDETRRCFGLGDQWPDWMRSDNLAEDAEFRFSCAASAMAQAASRLSTALAFAFADGTGETAEDVAREAFGLSIADPEALHHGLWQLNLALDRVDEPLYAPRYYARVVTRDEAHRWRIDRKVEERHSPGVTPTRWTHLSNEEQTARRTVKALGLDDLREEITDELDIERTIIERESTDQRLTEALAHFPAEEVAMLRLVAEEDISIAEARKRLGLPDSRRSAFYNRCKRLREQSVRGNAPRARCRAV